MAPPVVQVEGARELAAALSGIGAGLDHLDRAPKAAAAAITAAARRRAPRRTGHLAGSLRSRVAANTAEVGTSVSYGWPVHSGVPAHNMAPNPFLTDAMAETEPVWMPVYTAEVQNLVDRSVAAKAKTHE